MKLPGHLDLFSGCKIAAHELANRTGRWVLTFDVLHSPTEDLLDGEVQSHIAAMLRAGCFLSMQAGPVCASFSRAVRPPVRSALQPEGIDTMTEAMTQKQCPAGSPALQNWLYNWTYRSGLRIHRDLSYGFRQSGFDFLASISFRAS